MNDLDSDFPPTFWCEVILLRNFVEDCPDFSFVSSLQFLSCSSRIPLLSFAFPFLVGQWRPESHFLCVFFFEKKRHKHLERKKNLGKGENTTLCKKKIPYKKNTSTTKLLDKNNRSHFGSRLRFKSLRALDMHVCMSFECSWTEWTTQQKYDCCWQQQQRLQGWNCWIRNLLQQIEWHEECDAFDCVRCPFHDIWDAVAYGVLCTARCGSTVEVPELRLETWRERPWTLLLSLYQRELGHRQRPEHNQSEQRPHRSASNRIYGCRRSWHGDLFDCRKLPSRRRAWTNDHGSRQFCSSSRSLRSFCFALLRLEFAKFAVASIVLCSRRSGWDWSHLITATISSSPITTVIQSSGNGDTELEVLSPSSDSWTEAQIPDLCTSWTSVAQPNLCTTTSLAEQVQLPDFIDPIEDFAEEDSRSESIAVAGRSPKHPHTESDDSGMDVGILMEKAAEKAVEKAADRFSACMDAKN